MDQRKILDTILCLPEKPQIGLPAIIENEKPRIVDGEQLSLFALYAAINSPNVFIPEKGCGNFGWMIGVCWGDRKQINHYGGLWVDDLWHPKKWDVHIFSEDYIYNIKGWELFGIANRVQAQLLSSMPSDLRREMAKPCQTTEEISSRLLFLQGYLFKTLFRGEICYTYIQDVGLDAPDTVVKIIRFWDETELYLTQTGASLKPPDWMMSLERAKTESPEETSLRLAMQAYKNAKQPTMLN